MAQVDLSPGTTLVRDPDARSVEAGGGGVGLSA